MYNAAKKSFTETKNAGTDAAEKEAEQEPADDDESMQAMRDEGVEKLKQDSKDDDDDDEERQENNGKNKEEMGSGYDDIGDMGSGRGEDNDEEKEESQHHKGASKSSKQGEMAGEKEISQSSDEIPDLSGEFPPDADQASKLPEDPKTTPEEVDRELLDKRKWRWYVCFCQSIHTPHPFIDPFQFMHSPKDAVSACLSCFLSNIAQTNYQCLYIRFQTKATFSSPSDNVSSQSSNTKSLQPTGYYQGMSLRM